MNVLVFQTQFERPILDGRKIHTVRPHRRDARPRAVAGETVSLRVWSGRPYASPQREFARALVTTVEGLTVHEDGLEFGAGTLRATFWHARTRRTRVEAFARHDGFSGWEAMQSWFTRNHGLPFEGSLIRWTLVPVEVGTAGGHITAGRGNSHSTN